MHVLLHSVPPTLQQATTDWPMPSLETPRHSQASLGQSVGSVLLSSVYWCTRFCLCPLRIYFPVLCKLWQLYDGVNGDLFQEGLCHTQGCCTQNPCTCGIEQSTADPYLHRRWSHTVLSQSLWGPWVVVCTRFVWALWASLARMGFDSECEFTPPTISLGLLLCPLLWGISSRLLQCLLYYWRFSDLGRGVSLHGPSGDMLS